MLGALELKGLPEPVTTYEVAWTPAAEAAADEPARVAARAADATASSRSPGREAELAPPARALGRGAGRRAATRVRRRRAGHRQDAADRGARAAWRTTDGATVLFGRCDEDMGFSYQPFVEALRALRRPRRPPTTLREQLGRHGGDLVRLVPRARGRSSPSCPAPLQSDPEAERYRLFEAIAGLARRRSRATATVLLVLDDLHCGREAHPAAAAPRDPRPRRRAGPARRRHLPRHRARAHRTAGRDARRAAPSTGVERISLHRLGPRGDARGRSSTRPSTTRRSTEAPSTPRPRAIRSSPARCSGTCRSPAPSRRSTTGGSPTARSPSSASPRACARSSAAASCACSPPDERTLRPRLGHRARTSRSRAPR